MNKSVIGLFCVFFLSAPLFADSSWVCTYKGNSVKVSVNEATRMMKVVQADGSSDEGFAVQHEEPNSQFTQYRMGAAVDEYAHYFFVSHSEAAKPEYRACLFCAAFSCEAAPKGVPVSVTSIRESGE